MIPRVRLRDGTYVPALGQGTWHMGESKAAAAAEIAALRQGIDLGLTLIDTAEMYGDGGAEQIVAEAIAGRRGEVFLVSKVVPYNASKRGVPAACARSLKRLRTDRIDLYLLHWPGSTPLDETIEAFERLREAGHIGAWGVSNFDVAEMEDLAGAECGTNQVLYNPGARGIEFDLLPWCTQRAIPVMAYSPVGQGGRLLRAPALLEVARRHAATPAQAALAWCLRQPGVIAIPKATTPAHVKENAEAASLHLTEADLAEIDAAFPPPKRKRALEML